LHPQPTAGRELIPVCIDLPLKCSRPGPKIIEGVRQSQESAMYLEEPQARIGHRGSAVSRAKNLALKALVVVGGAVMLAGAFVVSLVFVAIGMVVVLLVGGYLWWQTRELRRQLRATLQGQSRPSGQVIEGEVISRERIVRE
jgi:hypothetical protein